MFRWLIYVFILANLSGCVTPVSSSCMDSQKHQNPNANTPHNTSKCSATDAAVYVMAATLKTLEDKTTKADVKEAVKCSDMVGKSQKECVRKEKKSYDPLDEL
ncbi:putative lipoprotein [Colwellia psychrerythraea 34H]|uniref:Putative lipoprotein n=2 Tax=Colwelliaceae TaxID=267889 RepID=Q47ZF4_COLP3|nr:putative lipoprotein [Colwellia psychrerythraea 34H]